MVPYYERNQWSLDSFILTMLRGIILVCLLVGTLAAYPTRADPAHPDSSPTVENIHINRNLVNSGDVLIYGTYNVPYTTPPTAPISSTFIFRLLDTDGSTELGSITPYVYHDGGYNHGLIAFYFPVTAGLVWDSAYIIRIAENPSAFSSPIATDITLGASDYSDETTQEANQDELAANLYIIGQDLETEYNKDFFQTAGGDQPIFTDDGETYFRGAINSLQAMAPNLFLAQTAEIDTSRTAWTTTQFDIYDDRFAGTWVGDAETATAEQFGMTEGMGMAMLIIAPLCIGAIIFSAMKFRRTEPGLVVAAVMLIMGVIMGWMPKAVFASTYQALGIYIAYLWFYARG